jgi:hypothetical protein
MGWALKTPHNPGPGAGSQDLHRENSWQLLQPAETLRCVNALTLHGSIEDGPMLDGQCGQDQIQHRDSNHSIPFQLGLQYRSSLDVHVHA